MLPESQRERIEVVLVSPRNPLNIGAVARAMANFGFERLTVVAPYAEHWREARSAVGAPGLLAVARETAALAEAVSHCTLVVGTGTLAHRQPEQPVIGLPDLAPSVLRELERGGRIALVFGSEKRGLARENLSYCHRLAVIPTDARQPSMNLGQAVAVCLYELAVRADAFAGTPAETSGVGVSNASAASGNLELLAGVIDKVMLEAKYSPASMREANRHDLRLLLRRLALTEPDGRRILGFFRRVLRRLERGETPGRGEDASTGKC